MKTQSDILLKKPLLENEQLYFIHVPKCAGTSFISYIDERYVNDEIIATHYDLQMLKEQITDEQLASYRFIRGHLPYDMIVPRLNKPPRIITFLREPVVRLVSNFQMRQRVSDPLHRLQSTLQSLTLDEFLARKDLMAVFANRATRLIGGTTIDRNGVEVPNIDLAKERLLQFEFVGIVEKYHDSLNLFSYVFDFPQIQSIRLLNVSPDREKRNQIHQSTLDRVTETEWADIQLYNFGREYFDWLYNKMIVELAKGVEYPPPQKVSAIEFDFSLVDPGMGWHVAERHPQYGVVRWSGPETISHLRFAVKPDRDQILKFDVLQSIAPDILDSLTVKVNGVTISLDKLQDKSTRYVHFVGRIPRGVLSLADGWTSLQFEVNRTVSPKDVDIQSRDTRPLGLCYHHLSLIPA